MNGRNVGIPRYKIAITSILFFFSLLFLYSSIWGYIELTSDVFGGIDLLSEGLLEGLLVAAIYISPGPFFFFVFSFACIYLIISYIRRYSDSARRKGTIIRTTAQSLLIQLLVSVAVFVPASLWLGMGLLVLIPLMYVSVPISLVAAGPFVLLNQFFGFATISLREPDVLLLMLVATAGFWFALTHYILWNARRRNAALPRL